MPLLLGGSIELRGYPLEMVHVEKIVTAVQRGIANTRWRDFADISLLSRRHEIDGTRQRGSMVTVAAHRDVTPRVTCGRARGLHRVRARSLGELGS